MERGAEIVTYNPNVTHQAFVGMVPARGAGPQLSQTTEFDTMTLAEANIK
jgi:hypothetical protein